MRAVAIGVPLLVALQICAGAAGPAMDSEAELQALALSPLEPARVAALLERLQREGDPLPLARARMLLCQQRVSTDPAEALDHAKAGFAVVPQQDATSAAVLSGLHLCRGYLRELEGDGLEALRDYDAAIQIGEGHASPGQLAQARVLRGEALYLSGDFSAALRDMQAAYAVYSSEANTRQQNYALNAIANLYADRRVGEQQKALETYRSLLGAHRESGDARGVATALYNIGNTLGQLDDAPAALEHLLQAIEAFEVLGDAESVAQTQRAAAVQLSEQERPEDALPFLQAADRFAKEHGSASLQAQVAGTYGRVLRQLQQPEAALQRLDSARSHYLQLDNPRFLEVVERERALALAALQRWQEAFVARSSELEHGARVARQMEADLPSRLRVQFEGELREQENLALQREAGLRSAALSAEQRARRLQAMATALASMLALVLLGFAWRASVRARAMRRLALTDELTHLTNRRAILARAEAARQSVLKGAQASVLLLDIDHFKQVNDRFGHELGDRVLQRVALSLTAALGSNADIGRFGGEEFLAVVKGGHGEVVAERLRLAIRTERWSELHPQLSVTTSIGVAALPEGTDAVDCAVRNADVALYRAKQDGRDRVCVYRAESR